MALKDLKWIRSTITGPRATTLKQFGLATSGPMRTGAATASHAALEAVEDWAEVMWPDLSEYPTPIAKARVLLESAAEVEHALMVQYLYAAYSLRDAVDSGLTTEQKTSIRNWRGKIIKTAVDEMGHLMTVQNLLLLLRLEHNFEREDFPIRQGVYPFPMHLEPLSKKSLAKYVVAEAPVDAADIDDIIAEATGVTGVPINRVGVLYAMLGIVFTKQGELESNASSGEPWSVSVWEASQALFEDFPEMPPTEWHLLNEHFDEASETRQAGEEWDWGSTRVIKAANRAAALEALAFISIQGEGIAAGGDSHFERFKSIYRGQASILPFPPEGDWLPTKLVPTDPVVGSTDPNGISETSAKLWAELANVRYALLLNWLQLYFHSQFNETSAREAIQDYCRVGTMHQLRDIGAILTSSNRHENVMTKAALPFTLPGVINNFPDLESNLALAKRRMLRSKSLVAELTKAGASGDVLADVLATDVQLATTLSLPFAGELEQTDSLLAPATELAATTGLAKADEEEVRAAKEAMIELLKSKRPQGRVMHGGIEIPGGGTLSQLFRDERYDDILQFLTTSTSVVEPFAGQPLVIPGDPERSAFYLQISDPNGVMLDKFTDDQIATVARWINSLATSAPPPPTSPKSFKCQAQVLVSGLTRPVCLVAAPGDARRLFIVEQKGKIKTFDFIAGRLLPTPLLTLSDISSGGERGLLGLAFHPNYPANPTIYVNCTNLQGATEIRSYEVVNDVAVLASKKLLLTVPQPFANHNGGWIAFGPKDGMLYIGMGDGGSGNDPNNNAQNLTTLLGKMLRIDVDRDDFPLDPNRNYGIPPTNPFVSDPTARPEIWAYGLRNPWRCSFDRQEANLLIGDVGQSAREEIDFQLASSPGGENYGWRLREGKLDTGLGSTAGLTLVDPIHDYPQPDGLAVIGGYVYRGSKFPFMQGAYFFGDHIGRVWTLDPNQPGTVIERTAELTESGNSLDALSTFGEDAHGELYYATLSGEVWSIHATELP